MKNNRGFRYQEFKDLHGSTCSIQESSLATDSAIWFGVDDPEDVLITTRMHLNREQINKLLPILQCFVETGELPDQEIERCK